MPVAHRPFRLPPLLLVGLALGWTSPTASLAQPRPAPAPTAAPGKTSPAPRPAPSAGGADGMDGLTKEAQELLENEGSLDTIVARNQFIKGVNLARQEQWSDAYPPLSDAWKHKKHWQIALNLGRVEFELGKYRDAAIHFEFVLRAPELARPSDGPDPRGNDRSLAVVWLAKAKSKLGHIRVDASPPGARIFVDGAPVGEVPLAGQVDVDPGKHTVEVGLDSVSKSKEVELQSGDEVTVQLKVRPPPSSSATARPPPAPPPPPRPPADAPAEPFPVRSVVLGTSAVLAATALIVGGASLALASEYSQTAAQQKQGPQGPHAVGEAQNKSLALWSFLGVGIIGGFAVTYHFVTVGPTVAVQAAPVAGPGGGGLLVTGRF